MATIKSYTDYSQAQILSKILPDESADMVYIATANDDIGDTLYTAEIKSEIYISEDDAERIINCWSLAALLSVLPDYSLSTNTDGTVFVVCESKKPMISDAYDNPVDACVSMIIKLHELKKL